MCHTLAPAPFYSASLSLQIHNGSADPFYIILLLLIHITCPMQWMEFLISIHLRYIHSLALFLSCLFHLTPKSQAKIKGYDPWHPASWVPGTPGLVLRMRGWTQEQYQLHPRLSPFRQTCLFICSVHQHTQIWKKKILCGAPLWLLLLISFLSETQLSSNVSMQSFFSLTIIWITVFASSMSLL